MGHEVDEDRPVAEKEDPNRPKSEVMRKFLERQGKLEYVRRGQALDSPEPKRHRHKKGVMLAYPVGQDVVVGWSLCHWKLDDFDAEQGVSIALDRALMWKEKETKRPNWEVAYTVKPPAPETVLANRVPQSIKEELISFVSRMRLFYKGKNFPMWVECLDKRYAHVLVTPGITFFPLPGER